MELIGATKTGQSPVGDTTATSQTVSVPAASASGTTPTPAVQGTGGVTTTWETTADWDGAQSETGVHHEQPTGTDWAASSIVEKGYPADWSHWSVPAPDLYLPLQEDSGTTAYDVMGTQDGTVSGPTVGNPNGILGNSSYEFDGDADSVTIAYDIDWTTASWSVVTWVHRDNTTFDSFAGGDEAVWGLDQPSGFASQCAQGLYFEDGSGDDGTMKYSVRGSGHIASSSDSYNDGNWHHFVITYDGTQNGAASMEMYIDGTVESTSEYATLASPKTSSGNRITVGRHYLAGEDRPYGPGEIGHFMLFSTELSSTDVSDIYNAVY